MVIAIFGESCTGKSTLAEKISAHVPCEIFTGKDYLRLAKNESIAKEAAGCGYGRTCSLCDYRKRAPAVAAGGGFAYIGDC